MKKITVFDVIKGTVFFALSCLLVLWLFKIPVIILKLTDSGIFMKLALSIFFIFVAIVTLAAVYSKTNENKNGKRCESELFANNHKVMQEDLLCFSNSLGSLPVLWFFGTIILIISILKNHHMFCSYLYFFAAGLLPLSYSLCIHSKVGSEALILFYGNFFNRKCISLFWEDVSRIYLSTYQTDYMASAGGRVWIPYKATRQHEGIRIALKSDFSVILNQCVEEQKSNIFSKDEIELDSENAEILIKQPPFMGFKRFLESISPYVDVKEALDRKRSIVEKIYTSGDMLAYFFIIMAMIGLYLLS
jgi:hypothetical protein